MANWLASALPVADAVSFEFDGINATAQYVMMAQRAPLMRLLAWAAPVHAQIVSAQGVSAQKLTIIGAPSIEPIQKPFYFHHRLPSLCQNLRHMIINL